MRYLLFVLIAASPVCGLAQLPQAQPTATATAASRLPQYGTIAEWGRMIDPDKDCTFVIESQSVSIRVPGTPHDLSAELDRMNAPRILAPAEGNFSVGVLVKGDFAPGEATIEGRTAYNGAGLLLMQDEQNYIRLERAVLKRGGQEQHYANFEARVDGRVIRIGTPSDLVITPEKSCYLRIDRVGNEIRGAVRQGNDAWHDLEPKQMELRDPLQVGVAAVNASSQDFNARFFGFFLSPRSAE